MTVIALASVKGAPGVTTAALALAARWPAGRKVLLVEADPFGGDLAPRYGSTVTGGLASLFAAARRTLTPEVVWDQVHQLPGGLPVLFGLSGVRQAAANEHVWPTITKAFAGLDADVVVDAGRLLPEFAGGVGAILAEADALVVLSESTLEAIVHLQNALPGLVAERQGRQLLVVPTGAPRYSAHDVAETLHVAVGPAMPIDRTAADALANRRRLRKLGKTPLLTWAAAVIAKLGIDQLPITASNTAETKPGMVSDHPVASDSELPPAPSDHSSPHDTSVGARAKLEARR
ncbi:MAG: MinD/ParA family ATP-binding protein [Rhizomicrobium sp.]